MARIFCSIKTTSGFSAFCSLVNFSCWSVFYCHVDSLLLGVIGDTNMNLTEAHILVDLHAYIHGYTDRCEFRIPVEMRTYIYECNCHVFHILAETHSCICIFSFHHMTFLVPYA